MRTRSTMCWHIFAPPLTQRRVRYLRKLCLPLSLALP